MNGGLLFAEPSRWTGTRQRAADDTLRGRSSQDDLFMAPDRPDPTQPDPVRPDPTRRDAERPEITPEKRRMRIVRWK